MIEIPLHVYGHDYKCFNITFHQSPTAFPGIGPHVDRPGIGPEICPGIGPGICPGIGPGIGPISALEV